MKWMNEVFSWVLAFIAVACLGYMVVMFALWFIHMLAHRFGW